MEDENGELIAYANSLWTFLDAVAGKPVNPDEKQLQAYALGEKLDMDYSSRKIAIPEGGYQSSCEQWTVCTYGPGISSGRFYSGTNAGRI